jgi:hypothetical protein
MKLIAWLLSGLLASTVALADVEVEASGHTLEEAKQQGFRKAIEQVVGVVVVSDQEVSGERVIKDTIGNYSAGYINNYKILDSDTDGDRITVRMSVDVASSKIAQRMIASGNKSLIIDGQRLQAQLDSQMYERQRGDQLIANVLGSYPENAFTINDGASEMKISRYRTASIEVPFELGMSREWLEALHEALGLVAVDATSCSTLTMNVDSSFKSARTSDAVNRLADKPCGLYPDLRVFYKRPGDFFASAHSFKFKDLNTLAMINNQLKPKLGQQRISVRADLLDAGGMSMDSRCVDVTTEAFIRHNQPNLPVVSSKEERLYSRPDIVGQNKFNVVLNINISNLANVGDLARVRLTVQRSCT